MRNYRMAGRMAECKKAGIPHCKNMKLAHATASMVRLDRKKDRPEEREENKKDMTGAIRAEFDRRQGSYHGDKSTMTPEQEKLAARRVIMHGQWDMANAKIKEADQKAKQAEAKAAEKKQIADQKKTDTANKAAQKAATTAANKRKAAGNMKLPTKKHRTEEEDKAYYVQLAEDPYDINHWDNFFAEADRKVYDSFERELTAKGWCKEYVANPVLFILKHGSKDEYMLATKFLEEQKEQPDSMDTESVEQPDAEAVENFNDIEALIDKAEAEAEQEEVEEDAVEEPKDKEALIDKAEVEAEQEEAEQEEVEEVDKPCLLSAAAAHIEEMEKDWYTRSSTLEWLSTLTPEQRRRESMYHDILEQSDDIFEAEEKVEEKLEEKLEVPIFQPKKFQFRLPNPELSKYTVSDYLDWLEAHDKTKFITFTKFNVPIDLALCPWVDVFLKAQRFLSNQPGTTILHRYTPLRSCDWYRGMQRYYYNSCMMKHYQKTQPDLYNVLIQKKHLSGHHTDEALIIKSWGLALVAQYLDEQEAEMEEEQVAEAKLKEEAKLNDTAVEQEAKVEESESESESEPDMP